MVRWVVETTLVAAALAAVAGLAPRVWRLGPAARHALWLAVLVKLVTPPLFAWPWPVAAPAGLGHATAAAESPRAAPERPAAAPEVTVRVVTRAAEPARAPAVAAVATAAAARPWLLGAWAVSSTVLALGQLARVVRFRRRLRGAAPAPAWLVREAERVAGRLGVRVPAAVTVPGLAVPMLWCLGRPRLLLPDRLVAAFGAERWRGVLAHELAHVRRGDPWVGRLLMVAGWVWWWNPVFRLARRRLEAEAELACDAWVVWALPGDRFAYAETLVEVCDSLARFGRPHATPAPALGVTGSGRFFERRLTMILRDHVPCRLTLPGALGAGLLTLLALPSWTAAGPPEPDAARPETAPATPRHATLRLVLRQRDDLDGAKPRPESAPRPKTRTRRSEAGGAAKDGNKDLNVVDLDDDDDDKDKGKGKDKDKGKGKGKDKATADIEIQIPDFGDLFGPDSDFAKSLEKLGPEIQKQLRDQLGPEFQARLKDVGEKVARELEKKLGPGSDFEARMKKLAERLEKSLNALSDADARVKDKSTKDDGDRPGARPRIESDRANPNAADRQSTPPAPRAVRRSRERKIEDLERKIRQLSDELKRLKAGDDDQDDDSVLPF